MQRRTNYQTLQDKLHQEAKNVLVELSLSTSLSRFGTPHIVGSMALELMTRKDIDIEIIVNDFSKEHISQIIQSLLHNPSLRIGFTVIDNTKPTNLTLPTGLYLGIQYCEDGLLIENIRNNPHVWQIDCWFVTKENARSNKKTEAIKARLTPEKRATILHIKSELNTHPLFKKSFSSIDIYTAVIEKNVFSVDDFLHLYH